MKEHVCTASCTHAPADAAVLAKRRELRQRRESWTGPAEGEWVGDRLVAPVPAERWPYGPPPAHQVGCSLHSGGLYCDCAASDASDGEFGEAP